MTGREPRVSVAIATFNGADYLEAQLLSILAQSRPVDEIVLSDDASRDGTVAVAERVLADADAVDVRILRNDVALGAAANFERALRATTGEILVLSDQDDLWHRDRIARAVEVLSAGDAPLLVHTDARRIDPEGNPLPHGLLASLRTTRREYREIERDESLRTLLRRNLVTGATSAFRRELLDLAGPFPDAWVHDEWLGIIAAATGGTRLVREQLVDYRQHDRNEIGAVDLTLAVRVGRLQSARTVRNARLLRRAEQFQRRIADLPPGALRAGVAEASAEKVAHERARSSYPAARFARLVPVVRELVTGRYSRFGRARFDIPRDLLQPAREAGG